MCTASCLSPVFKLCKLCFLISSASFWGGGYSLFGITFPPPMCFPSFEIFWPLVLFGRGKGDNFTFSLSLVSCALISVVALIPFSCLFCRCVGLGYAAGQISHQTSNMPAESGKRFKPSKYVPVSAAAIFLVGATTLFFAFTWVFSQRWYLGGTPWEVLGSFAFKAKWLGVRCLIEVNPDPRDVVGRVRKRLFSQLCYKFYAIGSSIFPCLPTSGITNVHIFLPSSIIRWSWSRKEVGGNHQRGLKFLKQSRKENLTRQKVFEIAVAFPLGMWSLNLRLWELRVLENFRIHLEDTPMREFGF